MPMKRYATWTEYRRTAWRGWRLAANVACFIASFVFLVSGLHEWYWFAPLLVFLWGSLLLQAPPLFRFSKHSDARTT